MEDTEYLEKPDLHSMFPHLEKQQKTIYETLKKKNKEIDEGENCKKNIRSYLKSNFFEKKAKRKIRVEPDYDNNMRIYKY